MLSQNSLLYATTTYAPLIWGATYIITSQMLPPGTPLLDAVLRALPAGLLLLTLTRTLPRGSWWWRSLVLGTLNIGAFFALLFIGATLLPGGVAATLGAIQPLLVSLLAHGLLGEKLSTRRVLAALLGMLGVGLLVLQAQARLDPLGVLAALGGAVSMALGVVLSKRWGQPARPLATTAWQLIWGGIVLLPALFLVEGLPTTPLTPLNLWGFALLSLAGTALAYALWFRGISRLPVSRTAFLGLLSPLSAVLLGWIILGQSLSPGQLCGAALVILALAWAIVPPRRRTRSDSATPPPFGVLPLEDCAKIR